MQNLGFAGRLRRLGSEQFKTKIFGGRSLGSTNKDATWLGAPRSDLPVSCALTPLDGPPRWRGGNAATICDPDGHRGGRRILDLVARGTAAIGTERDLAVVWPRRLRRPRPAAAGAGLSECAASRKRAVGLWRGRRGSVAGSGAWVAGVAHFPGGTVVGNWPGDRRRAGQCRWQGASLRGIGAERYVGRGTIDQVNYVLTAQFLVEQPYSTGFREIGLRPWLYKAVDAKEQRLTQCIALGAGAVVGRSDAQRAWGASALFYVAVLGMAIAATARGVARSVRRGRHWRARGRRRRQRWPPCYSMDSILSSARYGCFLLWWVSVAPARCRGGPRWC